MGALSTCIVASILGLLACGTATARVEPKIRVLLYNGSEPIRVGLSARPDEVKLAPGGGGLLVGGRKEASGWMPRGRGPWQVGTRTVRGQIAVTVETGQIVVLNRVGDGPARRAGLKRRNTGVHETLRARTGWE